MDETKPLPPLLYDAELSPHLRNKSWINKGLRKCFGSLFAGLNISQYQ